MTGRIDVHSHLLPGVDDGCESVEESIACARTLVAAGYTHSFCTPHFVEGFTNQTIEQTKEWTTALQGIFTDAGVSLTLIPGGEITLTPDLIQSLGPERLMTYGGWGRHCLVDIWADKLPDFFELNIKWLQSKGLTVILAHPERMKAVQTQPDLADYFDELGLLLQGNLQCLSDLPGTMTRTTGEKFLTEGRYFMLGSDLHKMKSLPARMAGLQFAIDRIGEAEVEKLTIHHPRLLMNGLV
ncbi:MAG: CpsB/CapC family capsule biosynthesis tyrosine phosphatase [Tepidisphaeraceae bacterium]|jgi:protein-tyrosine phosphatase